MQSQQEQLELQQQELIEEEGRQILIRSPTLERQTNKAREYVSRLTNFGMNLTVNNEEETERNEA